MQYNEAQCVYYSRPAASRPSCRCFCCPYACRGHGMNELVKAAALQLQGQ